ncbi:hypothetical protein [Nocardiopsis valliformis]|uniref:hypothetical protein n=1 Tax=Nocardiopsis valliformis TaxID=239974 RepID=UPI001360B306|nr:hypothetical protein [Nocardiopsis valliformis]
MVFGMILISALWTLFALAVIGEGFGLSGVLVASNIFSLFLWFELKIVFWRNISIEGGVLVVRGYLTKTVVPISGVSDVYVSGGAMLVSLEDGSVVNVPAFEGSLLSAIFGSPSAFRAAKRINEHLETWGEGRECGEDKKNSSLHLNLLPVPLIWVSSFMSFWILSGFVFP